MFAHTTTIWFVACPDPAEQLRRGLVADPDRTDDFIRRAYRGAVPSATASTQLSAIPSAPDEDVFAAHYGDLAVMAGRSLGTRSPDELTEFVTGLEPGWTVLLLSLDPAASTGVFARWEDGRLIRGFAADPVRIHADHGVPFRFENPFWAGERPLEYLPGVEPDPLDLPFHPAELAEEANREWLGFRFTPPAAEGDTDPSRIPLFAYRIGAEGATAVPASKVPVAPRPHAPAPAADDPAGPADAVPPTMIDGESEDPAHNGRSVAVAEPETGPVDAIDTAPAGEPTSPIAATATGHGPSGVDRNGTDTPAPTESTGKGRKRGPIARYFGFGGRL